MTNYSSVRGTSRAARTPPTSVSWLRLLIQTTKTRT